MINHARTLLINAPVTTTATAPGGEYVPADFVAVPLGGGLAAAHRLFFGARPDGLMLNYRAAQLLGIVAASPLADDLYRDDPRMTVQPGRRVELFPAAMFAPVGQPTELFAGEWFDFTGTPAAPDASGQTLFRYDVTVIDGDTVRVQRVAPTPQQTQTTVAVVDKVSTPVPLPGSGWSVVLTGLRSGARWAVDIALRPQRDPGQLLADLHGLGDSALADLFGVTSAEPWATYRRIWNDGRSSPLRLAAAVLALIAGVEQRRRLRG